ncbi:uncharacterized protein LOC109856672 [Pseudomyrmex gracilis]|uniref:uncharacterized protein LOC109856672 n=1 Tax=Pseudomyrmex gracilis TaxID=219809 RepID=UPI000994BBF8|nr:uncharacterized protein LOC109856672 [Pseudomyrmex gracilis]XP_020287799.1 uncharacterized protein LOC109856672 [Pseudomyrmex gracilis]
MIRISHILANLQIRSCRQIFTGASLLKTTNEQSSEFLVNENESPRMKQFHEKLELQPIPKIGPRERFVDLVLVNVDPKTGELIPDSEKEPTKWGDWQHGGRVSDF